MELFFATLFLTTSWTLVYCAITRDKMFFLQGDDNKTKLAVAWAGYEDKASGCEVFTDKQLIEEVLKSSGDKPIQKVSDEEMKSFLDDCKEFSLSRKKRQSGEFPDNGRGRDGYNNIRRDNFESYGNSDTANIRRGEGAGSSRGSSTRDSWRTNSSRRNEQRKPDSNRRPNSSEASFNSGRRNSNNRPFNNEEAREEVSKERNSDSSRNGHSNLSNANNDIETTTLPGEWGGPTKTPTTTEGYNGWPVIWPGTKWCGAGDIAKDYDDLGLHQDTDRCCRAHDLCNDTLAPGETRNNLTNKSSFTKLSCKCDQDFYDCLSRVNTLTSNTIGNMYFNLLKRECYTEDHPLTRRCKRFRTFLKLTCKEYERDTDGPKVYQWEKPKRYKKLPVPGPLTITLPI